MNLHYAYIPMGHSLCLATYTDAKELTDYK